MIRAALLVLALLLSACGGTPDAWDELDAPRSPELCPLGNGDCGDPPAPIAVVDAGPPLTTPHRQGGSR